MLTLTRKLGHLWHISLMCHIPMLYKGFLHENCKKKNLNYHFSWTDGPKTGSFTPLVSFCDEYLLRNKENVATEKTDIEFHNFHNTEEFLSFWHVDLMCHTSVLYWEFCMKNEKTPSLQLNWHPYDKLFGTSDTIMYTFE